RTKRIARKIIAAGTGATIGLVVGGFFKDDGPVGGKLPEDEVNRPMPDKPPVEAPVEPEPIEPAPDTVEPVPDSSEPVEPVPESPEPSPAPIEPTPEVVPEGIGEQWITIDE